jgi:hypothetical protein
MPRRKLTRLTVVLFAMCAVVDAPAAMSAQDWLDTIRPPMRPPRRADEPPPPECPGVGAVTFVPGAAAPSAEGQANLDALIKALTSPDQQKWKFSIDWLADPTATVELSRQRAAAIETAVRARPSLTAKRLSFAPAATRLKDCPRQASTDTLLLQLDWAGRWYGDE